MYWLLKTQVFLLKALLSFLHICDICSKWRALLLCMYQEKIENESECLEKWKKTNSFCFLSWLFARHIHHFWRMMLCCTRVVITTSIFASVASLASSLFVRKRPDSAINLGTTLTVCESHAAHLFSWWSEGQEEEDACSALLIYIIIIIVQRSKLVNNNFSS